MSLVRGTSIVAALTLVSRIFGFIRDLLVARLFGAGFYADAFFVAFRIPNLLRSLVAEGALTSAFVPLFASELKTSKERASATLRKVSGFLVAVTVLLTLLGIIFANQIVLVFAPGFVNNPNKLEICVLLTRLMMPYIVFVSLVAMLGGALNTIKIFGQAALAQVAMNIILIIGALWAAYYDPRIGVLILAASVLVGGLVQVLVQIPALSKASLRIWPDFHFFTPQIKELLKLMSPAMIGAAVYQLSIFINTLLASLLIEGSVSWLFYADRLVQLPLGIFSIALASVLLPTLSNSEASNNKGEFFGHLEDALRYTSIIILPMAFFIFVFANPIISLLFERGAFGSDSTTMTALAVQTLALGLWAVSCHSMLIRAFLAKKDTITPTVLGLISLVITFVLCLIFMGPPLTGEAEWILSLQKLPYISDLTVNYRHAGLGLASSISGYFVFVVTYVLVSRKHSIKFPMFIRSSIKALLACGLASVVSKSLVMPEMSAWQQVGLAGILFTASYALGLIILRARESSEFFTALRRRWPLTQHRS